MNSEALDQVIEVACALPELREWPLLRELLLRGKSADWVLPVAVAKATGAHSEDAFRAGAAIACIQVSIILIDDILDNDPRGAYHEYGVGTIANAALALQACGHRLIGQTSLASNQLALAHDVFAGIASQTAFGQKLDADNLSGEENYWLVTSTKSTPFFAGAFALGALMGRASSDLVEKLRHFGFLFGVICQINDDISDAMDPELNADWSEARNNLLFMFVEEGNNPYEEEFRALITKIHNDGSLARAQEILVRSGALSYAVYVAFEKMKEAMELLYSMNLPNPAPLQEYIDFAKEDFEHLLSFADIDTRQQIV